MSLEGMIRNSAGETATRQADTDTCEAAKTKLEALVGEGSALLWLRQG